MDFQLSSEQALIVETARKIGESFGLDYWRKTDASGNFPREIWKAICDAGLCGAVLPQESGGGGAGMLELVLAIEALSAGGGGVVLAQLFMINPLFGGLGIARYGTERMKRDILPGLINGRYKICFALTEPDSGNNSLNLRTFARSVQDGWRLSGQKVWITAVDAADFIMVVARTRRAEDVARRTDGISIFLFDAKRDGIRHQRIDKSATNSLASSMLFFDEVHISPDEIMGTVDNGWPALIDLLNGERVITAAGLVGAGELAIRLAVAYARDRKIFGNRPIASYQSIQFPLAKAHAELECARLMNRKAATLMDRGLAFASEANIAKFMAAEAAVAATDRAVQTLGAMGFACEYHVERLWRDTRVFAVAPVPQEMILSFLAAHDLSLPRSY
jgi:acyl-CoA dehydrogenase